MTAEELYAILDAADLDYDVVEIWDGLRTINFEVCTDEEDTTTHYTTEGEEK